MIREIHSEELERMLGTARIRQLGRPVNLDNSEIMAIRHIETGYKVRKAKSQLNKIPKKKDGSFPDAYMRGEPLTFMSPCSITDYTPVVFYEITKGETVDDRK